MALDHKAHNLVEALRALGGEELLATITEGLAEPTSSTTPRRKAQWATEVVSRMERHMSPELCRQVMGRCSCHVRPEGIRKDKELWKQCSSLEEFARAKREEGWTDGFLAEGDTLRLRISTGWCHCGLVRDRAEPVSKTYCLCCAEHLRHGFEPVFGCPVRFVPESTLISGGAECWFAARVEPPRRAG